VDGAQPAQQLFSAVVAAGGAELDHSGMVKALEALAAHKVAPDPTT